MAGRDSREAGGFDGLENDGLETRRWNGTKSAFAEYAAAAVWGAGSSVSYDNARRAFRLKSHRRAEVALRTSIEAQSAKADFVLLQRRVSNPSMASNPSMVVRKGRIKQ